MIVIVINMASLITSFFLYNKSTKEDDLTLSTTPQPTTPQPTTKPQPTTTPAPTTTQPLIVFTDVNVEDTTGEMKIVTTPAPTTGSNFIISPVSTTRAPETTIAPEIIVAPESTAPSPTTIFTMPTETYPLLITYNANNINMFLNIDFNTDPPFAFSELHPVNNLLQYSLDTNDIFIDNLYLKYENKMLVLAPRAQNTDNHIMKNFYGILYLNSDIYLQNMLIINNSEFIFAPNINMYFELIDRSTITTPNRFVIKCNGIDKFIYIDNTLNTTNNNSMNTFNRKQIDTTRYILSFETNFIKFDTSINKFVFTQDETAATIFKNNKYLLFNDTLNDTFILYDKENQLRTTPELNATNIVKWYAVD